jgi:hypothetical protein
MATTTITTTRTKTTTEENAFVEHEVPALSFHDGAGTDVLSEREVARASRYFFLEQQARHSSPLPLS